MLLFLIFKWCVCGSIHYFCLFPALHRQTSRWLFLRVLPFPFNWSSIHVTCQWNCLYESHNGIEESWQVKQVSGCKHVLSWSPRPYTVLLYIPAGQPSSWALSWLLWYDRKLSPFASVNETPQFCLLLPTGFSLCHGDVCSSVPTFIMCHFLIPLEDFFTALTKT